MEIRHKTPTLLHREPDSTPYVMANWKTKQWRNTCNILFTQIIQAIGSDQLSQIAGILTRRHSGSFSAVWRIILDHVKIHRGYGTRKDSPPLKKFQDSVEALITQQTSAFLPIVFRVHLQKLSNPPIPSSPRVVPWTSALAIATLNHATLTA